MIDAQPLDLVTDPKNYSKAFVFFSNLSLEHDKIRYHLEPILESLCHKIEFAYKSPSKVSFISAIAIENSSFENLLQFDDVTVKVLHSDSGKEIFITLGSRLARALLVRLLATSLIDESQGLLFSATEKGIFSFVLTRLLFEIKNTLKDDMPNLKLLGIYNSQDEALKSVDILGYGAYNFALSFAADQYPVTLISPLGIFNSKEREIFYSERMLDRCGHMTRNFSLKLKILSMDFKTIEGLQLGDLILFDRSELTFVDQGLEGPIKAVWNDFLLKGNLFQESGKYHFSLKQGDFLIRSEGVNMEETEISGATNAGDFNHPLADNSRLNGIANNIRVPVSIELSRMPLTLKEICNLKDGSIIDLNRKLDDPLEIVVEGKVIGHCLPVQIEGRLGIRILQIDGNEEQANPVA